MQALAHTGVCNSEVQTIWQWPRQIERNLAACSPRVQVAFPAYGMVPTTIGVHGVVFIDHYLLRETQINHYCVLRQTRSRAHAVER